MSHTHARTLGQALAMLGLVFTLGFVPVALAQGGDDRPVSRSVVATVTSIDANTDTATLKTEEGEVFEYPEGRQWHVGHKVLCDRVRSGSGPQLQQCIPYESAQDHKRATQEVSAPRR